MSRYDYLESQKISGQNYPFYSLIMAAMRQADSDNIKLLRTAFPAVYVELTRRYVAPRGVLPQDEPQ